MILAYQIHPQPLGAAELIYKFRESVSNSPIIRKLNFRKVHDAKVELQKEKRRILIAQVSNYITHCKKIIAGSDCPAGAKWKACEEAMGILRYAHNKVSGETTLRQISKFVLINRSHLKTMLPHPNNNGYCTALGNLDEILMQAQEYSKRKRVTQLN